MRKHYRQELFSYAAIDASTAFRLLTRLQSVPIVAALQSVGEFSRAFSKTLDEKYLCEINCDS
jgi:hypothetical protein